MVSIEHVMAVKINAAVVKKEAWQKSIPASQPSNDRRMSHIADDRKPT